MHGVFQGCMLAKGEIAKGNPLIDFPKEQLNVSVFILQDNEIYNGLQNYRLYPRQTACDRFRKATGKT